MKKFVLTTLLVTVAVASSLAQASSKATVVRHIQSLRSVAAQAIPLTEETVSAYIDDAIRAMDTLGNSRYSKILLKEIMSSGRSLTSDEVRKIYEVWHSGRVLTDLLQDAIKIYDVESTLALARFINEESVTIASDRTSLLEAVGIFLTQFENGRIKWADLEKGKVVDDLHSEAVAAIADLADTTITVPKTIE